MLEPAKEFASHQNAPNWLEIDRDKYKGRVLALPKREDINLPVNEQLIVELVQQVSLRLRAQSSARAEARLF